MPTPHHLPHRRLGVLRASLIGTLGAMALIVGIVSTSAIAVAATGTTLAAGKATVQGKTRTVVVDSHGRTLYTLSGENVRHLKCTSKSCLKAWPPYKVPAGIKLSEAKGVNGKIGTVRRGGGKFSQVTLNGRPLYLFMGDHKKGVANGEGLVSAGGTWHVVSS